MQASPSLTPTHPVSPFNFGQASSQPEHTSLNVRHQSVARYAQGLAQLLTQCFLQYWETSPEWMFCWAKPQLKQPYGTLKCHTLDRTLERVDETGASVFGSVELRLPQGLMYLQCRKVFGPVEAGSTLRLSGLEAFSMGRFLTASLEALSDHVQQLAHAHSATTHTSLPQFLPGQDWWLCFKASPASLKQVFSESIELVEHAKPLLLVRVTGSFIPMVLFDQAMPPMPWPQFLAWNESLGSPLASQINLMAGTTSATIQELKELEVGDLVVLENSQLGQLGFSHPDAPAWQSFPFNSQSVLQALEHIDVEAPPQVQRPNP